MARKIDNRVILIPARMASTRLPNKPLALCGGAPMIVQVWRRACEANCGRVVVAAAEREIADAVRAEGGEAVLTDADLPSGSDRIFAALQHIDPSGSHDAIVNLQGDLPTLDPSLIGAALACLPYGDIATLAAEITEAERDNPNVEGGFIHAATANRRALYFTRATAPYGDGALYHHIGLYAYWREALARFVALPPSPLKPAKSWSNCGHWKPVWKWRWPVSTPCRSVLIRLPIWRCGCHAERAG